MEKKYLNIILVVILVIIWGSIINKYFGKKTTDNNMVALNPLISNYTYSQEMSKDTFQLKLINTNPFKASIKKNKSKMVLNNNMQKKKNLKKGTDKNVPWPTISYHGFVKGEDKKTKLVILKVNNRLYRKREKEKINELLVVKAYKDSLIISNNKELKTIKKIDETE